ncbi:MAG: general secretion pathway protein GspD [Betaproteobacteria bacterium]|jgi:general secretion pathway protein D|nr:general secretion pathway protein GspD [Betaproteobacteria bacterium]
MKREQIVPRFLRHLSIIIAAVVLSACASTQAYRDGQALIASGEIERGLAHLEEAVKTEPNNAEYRIALATHRASAINQSVSLAEQAWRDGRLAEAEKNWRFAQSLDPENSMARQGLDRIALELRHRQIIAEAETLFKKGGASNQEEALAKLRPVLVENPSNKTALRLKAQIEVARAEFARPGMRLGERFRKPITLSFNDAPLRAVLEAISKVSDLNFFYDKDVPPDARASISAKNTTVEDTLRVVLATNKLEQKVLNENSILIYPATPEKIRDYQTLTIRSFYLVNANVQAVANTIRAIIGTKNIVVDDRLGLIIMRDTPEAIRMAERIVALQDEHDPEVMLEVEILEVKRSKMMELGIQWPGTLTLSPLDSVVTLADLRKLNSSMIGTTASTTGNLTINASKERQNSNILANPRIRVRNKEKARIQIGDRVPVITTTSTSTGFVSESVNYVDVGLKLEVEPNIYLDEEVAIKVNLEVSNLVREIKSQTTGTLSYQIGTRNATTVLQLKDGETQILAGLISDEDRVTANRMPLLGDLPVLNRLFGSQKDDSQRSEILLSITPRVLRTIRRQDIQASEFESGTESSMGAASLQLRDTGGTQTPSSAAKEPKTRDAPPAATQPDPILDNQ